MVVEAEGELSWHPLLHKGDFKVLYLLQIDRVECCLIRVHRTLLFPVVTV